MEMTINMPFVDTCTISQCAYNKDDKCHARAITIGNGTHPGCDTSYLGAPFHTRANSMAGVGACKVAKCNLNNDLECIADNIDVGMHEGTIQCMSYQTG